MRILSDQWYCEKKNSFFHSIYPEISCCVLCKVSLDDYDFYAPDYRYPILIPKSRIAGKKIEDAFLVYRLCTGDKWTYWVYKPL
jgi:hypothetical protein